MALRGELRARGSGEATCPYCREALGDASQARGCVSCHTGYHQECLDEFGGCSTLGCAGGGFVALRADLGLCAACARPIALTADTRQCATCQREYHRGCLATGCAHGCHLVPVPLLDPRVFRRLRLAAFVLVGLWVATLLKDTMNSLTVAGLVVMTALIVGTTPDPPAGPGSSEAPPAVP